LEHYRDNAVPLFAVTPKGAIEFFTETQELSPKPEWNVVSLLMPSPKIAEFN